MGRPLPEEEKVVEETEDSTTASELGKFIQFDPYEKARHKFVFVDISQGAALKSRKLLVREPNGDLRTGTRSERLQIARSVWGKSANKFMQ